MAGIFALSSVLSQTKKGDKLVGAGIGSISYSKADNESKYDNLPTIFTGDESAFSVSVNPNVAWFVMDNLAVGGSVMVGFSTDKDNNTTSGNLITIKSNEISIYIGPLARYYFGGSSKGMPFAQVNFQIGINNYKSTNGANTANYTVTKGKTKEDWNAGLSVGYEHFITKNTGLYGSFGFNYGKKKIVYKSEPVSGGGLVLTDKESKFSIPVNIGLQVHLAGKAKKK